MTLKSRDVARAVILVAMAVALGFVSLPVGITRLSPGQHLVNVLSAVLLGPGYALGIATAAAVIRNVLGVGTLLAFPGGMIGALLAGLAYRAFRNMYAAGAGEIIGTGILGSLLSAWLVAPIFMGKTMALATLMVAFSLSTLSGTMIGIIALHFLRKTGIWES